MLVLLGKTIFGMLKEITSKSNPFIKEVLKIKQKKAENDLTLIEGERFIFEAYKRGKKIYAILFVEPPGFIDKIKCDCYKITQPIASLLSSTVNSSGIFAVLELKDSVFVEPKAKFLVLDKVMDPGNLGTIIRTALAFGYKDIYMYNCVDWRNDKVLRSTVGTIFDINLYQVNLAQIKTLSKYVLITADMGGKDINTVKIQENIFGIILGNEANGVSSEVGNLSKMSVSIPMQNGVESLNVAVAGAIFMSKL